MSWLWNYWLIWSLIGWIHLLESFIVHWSSFLLCVEIDWQKLEQKSSFFALKSITKFVFLLCCTGMLMIHFDITNWWCDFHFHLLFILSSFVCCSLFFFCKNGKNCLNCDQFDFMFGLNSFYSAVCIAQSQIFIAWI